MDGKHELECPYTDFFGRSCICSYLRKAQARALREAAQSKFTFIDEAEPCNYVIMTADLDKMADRIERGEQ